MRTAIYPGSFDPLTNGHLDVVQRAAKLFDRVVIAVAKNEGKNPTFTHAERLALVKQAVKHIPNVESDAFDSLLVEYVVSRKAQAIVRGLRAVSDFEFEFQLALMNRKLDENIETIFMMPKDTYTFLSSRIVKEIARLGDDSPIAYLSPDDRYVEKLATPDVTIADLIGDIDPIKAARGGHELSSELTVHYGLLPRANRRIFAVFYFLSGFGITAGYHRLFTHRSFQTYPLIRGIFAVLGSMAIQGSVPDWVADHRKHHAYADEEGDPHSPHAGHAGGPLRGFVHAHFGWLFADEKASRQRYVPDLLDDPVVMAVHRRFALIVVLSYFLAPVTAGLIATRRLRGGLSAFLWGGALRVFFVHHATWSVNSVCHLWGKRPFETRDESRNNPLVALVGLGEGNHHNHHAFPRSAKHGLQPWQFDPTWWLIWTMEQTGLAWDVQRVSSKEMERKRVAEPATPGARGDSSLI